MSDAGLVPVMELATLTGLGDLLGEHVRFRQEKIRSGAANAAAKLEFVVAGMLTGADSIADLDRVRAGGGKLLFSGVFAASTAGILLREFTHGHTLQLAAVLRRHLVRLHQRTGVLAGIEEQAFVDIDSLLRPVYGRAKEGASFGHTKIAGKSVLRRGLSPLAVTISTPRAAPVLAGVRLRRGSAGSAKGAASMVRDGIRTARDCGATRILLRGDSAYGNSKVAAVCLDEGVDFSLTLERSALLDAAISTISDDAWTPVHYPDAFVDLVTGELISHAHVAEIAYTAFTSTDRPVTARLIVRRVLDANTQDPLFPVWRYHPFLTSSDPNTYDTVAADLAHRHHAVCETTWSDLIDGPWAHQPSGHFNANAAWSILAAITHNLLRATAALTALPGAPSTRARGATIRRTIINVPARLARPARKPVLHLPTRWPTTRTWNRLWNNIFQT